jgi:hypothetical protein
MCSMTERGYLSSCRRAICDAMASALGASVPSISRKMLPGKRGKTRGLLKLSSRSGM